MDEFVDGLLTEERYLDVILPRMTQRFVLEDSGDLDVRESILQDELDELDNAERNEASETEVDAIEETKVVIESEIVEKPIQIKKNSEKKISKLFKQKTSSSKEDNVLKYLPTKPVERRNDNGNVSIEETNKMRASLGLKPLK